jgi:DNA-binding CsgD family transcriptional regulator
MLKTATESIVVEIATALHAAEPTGENPHKWTLEIIEASVRAATAPDSAALTMADCARSVLCNAAGQYENAFHFAERASSREDIGHLVWSLCEIVEAAVRSGRPDHAAVAAERLHRLTSADDDAHCALRARTRALLATDATAETLYQEAIAGFAACGLHLHGARAHLLYGEWLRREGRRIDARTQLRRALAAFVDHGYCDFADRARRELAATCERARRRQCQSELTAQEAEIARLAGDGHTNAEIGIVLYISPRTVEWHMRKVFSKLGISSRRALVAGRAAVRAA